ncbi:tetratricopeptide repeat protein [Treponema sp. R6D11]
MKRNIFFLLICFLIFSAAVYGQEYDSQALRFLKSGVQNLMNGNFNKAIEDCNRVIRIDPDSALTYVIRARAYFELGDMDRAIADSTQAIKRDKENIGAYSIRGNAYGKKGDLDRAIADWKAILKINPDYDDAKLNIEKASLQRGF